jgi:soluble lytic murein transglycosylase
LAIGPLILPLAAIILSSAACQDTKASSKIEAGSSTDTTHVVNDADRQLVLRARALDRADSLDAARSAYEEAAKRIPNLSDWLYLRAAGVTGDSSARADYFDKVKTPVARDRIRWTDAIARERNHDIPGAIRVYTSVGARLDALRLRVSPPADSAAVAAARGDLLSFIRTSNTSAETRDAISLFDKVFPNPSAAEDLTIAQAAARSGVPDRAATGFARAFKSLPRTPTDVFSYASVLYRLRKYGDAATQFAAVRNPPALAAGAQYQRARALVAMGNATGGRAALRALTTAYPADTSAANAYLLLADLATDENRDADARSTLLAMLKKFPAGRQASSARFRVGLISYIQGDRKAAAAEFDSLVARDSSSTDALAAGYWAGRSYAALGNSANARARWRWVTAKEPLSYYAVASAKRLDSVLVKVDRSTPTNASLPDVDAASNRISSLRDVGMDVEAGFESDRLFRDALQDSTRLFATSRALAGGDQAGRSIALGKRAIDTFGPSTAAYRLYFPVLERETLIASAKANHLDPVMVAALIRQESNFNPKATSPVGARGLMQLMPSVGASIAAGKGIRPWNDSLLYDPRINIRLGTSHLTGLVQKYPEIVKVLAAYNAGESRVTRWSTKAGAADPEVFAERIPFVETRDYVRIVIRNRAYYEALYPW